MAFSYPLRLNNILVLVVRVARRHTFLHPLLVLRPLPTPTITPIYCDTPQLMGSESVSLMFTESWLDAPGPSRCTCVLPAWTSAARVPKDTTLSTDDHDGKMKTRWSKALLTGRNRSVARAARLSATLAHSNQPPVHIAPHHHLCSVTVPLTSTSDVSLKNDSSEVDIWDTTDEECCTRPVCFLSHHTFE